MEVDSETPVVVESSEKVVVAAAEVTESPEKPEAPVVVKDSESPTKKKNNGTLSNIAAAAAANAAAVKKDEEARKSVSGVVVQFPEMFSVKRDSHILQRFTEASDVRMQKIAFVECESEEAAVKLQTELNGTTLNNKKLTTSRMDTTEKNVLYLGALKAETTDDILKTLLPGIEEIRREKYNTFILFSSESECRTARSKVQKGGINGQILHCDFDMRKDRFKPAEEPAPKKAKEDLAETEKEGDESKKEGESEETKTAAAEEEEEGNKEEEAAEEENVKADEW